MRNILNNINAHFKMNNHTQNLILFKAESGSICIDVRLNTDTVWLNLNQLAKLFERDKSVISRHIKKIFKEEELDPHTTVSNFATVQHEGGHDVQRDIEHYSNTDFL